MIYMYAYISCISYLYIIYCMNCTTYMRIISLQQNPIGALNSSSGHRIIAREPLA